MKIVSTTIVGATPQLLEDALASVVDWVDLCLLITTDLSRAEDCRNAALRVVPKPKLVAVHFEWPGSAADARNETLYRAHLVGADWALTLDADERMHASGDAVRAELEALPEAVGVVLADHESGTYSKERLIRVSNGFPTWKGPAHEALSSKSARATMATLTFSELQKTQAEQNAKDAAVIAALTPYVAEHPTEPRWLFYLAESYRNLCQWQQAVELYARCYELDGWNEESAWACYLAATCCAKQDNHRASLAWCVKGLGRHAGIAELAWLAAFSCYQLGRDREACIWAELATARGAFRGDLHAQKRIGFKDPFALWEGPYNVLAFAAARLGDTNNAEWATRMARQAEAARRKS